MDNNHLNEVLEYASKFTSTILFVNDMNIEVLNNINIAFASEKYIYKKKVLNIVLFA